MRSKKLIKNTIFSLLEDFVAIICSFILPKLILSNYGSEYNGLITSITQFLTCAVLLRSGIGGATKAALYKPLADNNKDEIDSILKATNIFMKKIAVILGISIVVFASIYPFLANTNFSWIFTFALFVIIGLSTFAESFFGITYLILLQADQKLYISSIFKIIGYILNIIIASLLIIFGHSIHIVKLASAIAFCIHPIAINLYVNKKYKVNKNVVPNNKAISQRWDAFWHQVAVFVTNNTDVMVLTIFTNMFEVSVYSVYHLVIAGLKRFITAFTQGIDAAFGNMIAKGEHKELNKNLSIIELIIYSISTIIFSCAILLILQFVKIYTIGIEDANYFRPMFAYILLAAEFFYAIRLPYQFVVQGAGHFKQTKNYALIECILNITISIILVIKFGLVGISIGTFIAVLYKTLTFSNYMSKHIINRSSWITLKKCAISLFEFIIIFFIMKFIELPVYNNYINWIFNSCVTMCVAFFVVALGVMVFYRKDYNNMLSKVKYLLKKK